jgi:flagella synthesis protein FlgN
MNKQVFTEINDMIQQDLAASRQLLALLEEETNATKTRNYATLSHCLEVKTPLLEQLQENAKTRTDWLNSINKDINKDTNKGSDEANWISLINVTNDIDLKQQWHEVKKTIEHCQHINTINGKLISRGVNSHSRLLQMMRGNINQADLYNAKGNKLSTLSSGSLTQA